MDIVLLSIGVALLVVVPPILIVVGLLPGRTPKYRVLLKNCPYAASAVDEEITRVLDVMENVAPDLGDALERVLHKYPFEIMFDNGHVRAHCGMLRDYDVRPASIRTSGLDHALAHLALKAVEGARPDAHHHAVFRAL